MDIKFTNQVLEAKVASRPKIWPQSRPQSFGLGIGLGLKHLASAWPRFTAEEPAAKKRQLLVLLLQTWKR